MERRPLRLPRLTNPRPIRYLGRRVLQAMADNAVSNFLLGRRAVPARFVAVRLAGSEEERGALEQEFSDSRAAIEQEVMREAGARQYQLRSSFDLQLFVVTEADLEEGSAVLAAAAAQAGIEPGPLAAQLREQGEIILCRPTRAVQVESDPPGAAVYLEGRQVDRVTPCTVNDLPVGEYRIKLALPGYVIHEARFQVEDHPARRQRYFARLEPEPPMGLLEVRTFPSRAAVRVGDEVRESPASFRTPAGRYRVECSLPDYEPVALEVEVHPSEREQAQPVTLRLRYAGPDRDEPVGRLIVYQPDPLAAPPVAVPEPPNEIAAFFRDREAPEPGATPVAGERLLQRGVLVIGRDDPRESITPDVKLRDPGNTVSRGCHAWLHVYSDPGTGADYNTFVIHNNSSKGIRVDGKLVTTSTALSEDALVEVGIFRLRILKERPRPSVEL